MKGVGLIGCENPTRAEHLRPSPPFPPPVTRGDHGLHYPGTRSGPAGGGGFVSLTQAGLSMTEQAELASHTRGTPHSAPLHVV